MFLYVSQNMKSPLDICGEMLIQSLRDSGLNEASTLIKNSSRSPSVQELQDSLASLTDDQKVTVMKLVDRCITTGIHDFLFRLDSLSGEDDSVEIRSCGKNIAELSDGLYGELFSDQGWISRFSDFKENYSG